MLSVSSSPSLASSSLPGPGASSQSPSWDPALFGVYWLPGTVVTLLIFLLIASSTQRTPRTRREARAPLNVRQTAVAAFGFLLWIVVAGLVVTVVLAHAP